MPGSEASGSPVGPQPVLLGGVGRHGGGQQGQRLGGGGRAFGRVGGETELRPHFALEAFSDLERDIRHSIARIKASPFVLNKDSVRGFVYAVTTGELEEAA